MGRSSSAHPVISGATSPGMETQSAAGRKIEGRAVCKESPWLQVWAWPPGLFRALCAWFSLSSSRETVWKVPAQACCGLHAGQAGRTEGLSAEGGGDGAVASYWSLPCCPGAGGGLLEEVPQQPAPYVTCTSHRRDSRCRGRQRGGEHRGSSEPQASSGAAPPLVASQRHPASASSVTHYLSEYIK